MKNDYLLNTKSAKEYVMNSKLHDLSPTSYFFLQFVSFSKKNRIDIHIQRVCVCPTEAVTWFQFFVIIFFPSTKRKINSLMHILNIY